MIFEMLLAASSMFGSPDLVACPRTHEMPGYPPAAVVIVVDGEVVGPQGGTPAQQRLLTEMEAPGIMEQRCWNPDTDELGMNGGIQLILLATPERVMEAETEAIRVAGMVSTYLEEENSAPTSLEFLGAAAQGYQLELVEQGWRVVATDASAVHCSVFQDGDAGSRVVECGLNYALIKRNLRVVHESGQAF